MKDASFHKNHETTPHLLNTHRDGRGVTRYRNYEKVNRGDGQPYAGDWRCHFSPLDAVFWIVLAHYGVYSPPDRIAWGSAEHPITHYIFFHFIHSYKQHIQRLLHSFMNTNNTSNN